MTSCVRFVASTRTALRSHAHTAMPSVCAVWAPSLPPSLPLCVRWLQLELKIPAPPSYRQYGISAFLPPRDPQDDTQGVACGRGRGGGERADDGQMSCWSPSSSRRITPLCPSLDGERGEGRAERWLSVFCFMRRAHRKVCVVRRSGGMRAERVDESRKDVRERNK